jgi:ATP-dependent RNA helicase HelY
VFATETLALGINMPARTVVLERLDKFNGEGRVQITPGEYMSSPGALGVEESIVKAIQLFSGLATSDPNVVAGLASKRTYPLISSFRPTYNMSVNLVAFGRERAREVLETSFAQFQADRSVVGLARGIRDRETSLAGFARGHALPFG